MIHNMELRTLCYKCKSNYEAAGYEVINYKRQKNKSPCEICHRFGFEYKVRRKSCANINGRG